MLFSRFIGLQPDYKTESTPRTENARVLPLDCCGCTSRDCRPREQRMADHSQVRQEAQFRHRRPQFHLRAKLWRSACKGTLFLIPAASAAS